MVTLIAEEVKVSQREVEEGGDARCGRRNHPLFLVSRIANGKVETEGSVTVVTRVISSVAASRGVRRYDRS